MNYSSIFHQLVACNYQRYNTLFLALPFEGIRNTGTSLPLFDAHIKRWMNEGLEPIEAIDSFFKDVLKLPDREKIPVLFSFIQYIERQVLLFDALEDASFEKYTNLEGQGSLAQLLQDISKKTERQTLEDLLEGHSIRVVLTAHPTQFYSNVILDILRDLTEAIQKDSPQLVHDLLLQLGKTPFQNRQRPSPLDEANSLLWILENVFYRVIPQIRQQLKTFASKDLSSPFIEVGFWPGGDRDGNPTVTATITMQVLENLRNSLLSLYIKDVQALAKRLTFRGIAEPLQLIQERLQHTLKFPKNPQAYSNTAELLDDCQQLKTDLVELHSGLFVEKLERFICTVEAFGFHFVHLDLRQHRSVHQKVLETLAQPFEGTSLPQDVEECLATFQVAKKAQEFFGTSALHRYIISGTQSHQDLLDALNCAVQSGWEKKDLSLDFVPLFESIQDLKNAPSIMQALYEHPLYQEHLQSRQNKQTIMLGFSDGTKDGGYVTANWAILQCRKHLLQISEKYGIKITFFDGKGGPPARGGGNAHDFYRAMSTFPSDIHLTIQGQTITTKYGTMKAARYNLEQLLTAALRPLLFEKEKEAPLSEEQCALIEKISETSYKKYSSLTNNPLFFSYLEEISPLPYFGDLNIASRPASRGHSKHLSLDSLRAIPFVGSWSQVKQNIPGYYGMGSALKDLIDAGQKEPLKKLYQSSGFFFTLINNCMQSLIKSNFSLTQYLEQDPQYADLWNDLKTEAQICEQVLLEISGNQNLLDKDPAIQQSLYLREALIAPLTVIQQYALAQLRKKSSPHTPWEKLVKRSIAAILNASRNSA